jgi:hypothetical protein
VAWNFRFPLEKEQLMLLRKFTGLLLSSALVISLVGCDAGDAPAPVDIETPATPGMDETEETETDTDADWDLDDDTTTGN